MTSNRPTLKVHAHSVENLMEIFESNTFNAPKTATCTQALNPPMSRARQGSWRLEHGIDAQEIVREKIRIFEKGCYESMSFNVKRSSSLEDMETLILNDLMTRKSELLEHIQQSNRNPAKLRDRTHSLLKETLLDVSNTMHDPLSSNQSLRRGCRRSHRRASTGEMPGSSDLPQHEEPALSTDIDSQLQLPNTYTEDPPRRRFRMERRASTGRVHFAEAPTVWEFTDTFATQLRLPQSFSEGGKLVSDKAPRPPSHPGLRRRHSTGCLNVCNEDDESSIAAKHGFWQVYEQDDSGPPKLPLRKNFAKRRTVRFDQHVTVWVFAKEGPPEKDLVLPQSFVRRPSDRISIPLRKPRRSTPRRSGEERFSSNGEKTPSASPPNMPCRRHTTPDMIHNVELPQSGGDFGVSIALPSVGSQHSPQIPRRRPSVQERDIPQMPQRRSSVQEDDPQNIAHLLEDFETSSLASFEDCNDEESVSSFHENHAVHVAAIPAGGTPDDEDYFSEKQRRARAIIWFRRWAMPSYETMKVLVQKTVGLDITLEDVDLLPWDKAEYKRTKGCFQTDRASAA